MTRVERSCYLQSACRQSTGDGHSEWLQLWMMPEKHSNRGLGGVLVEAAPTIRVLHCGERIKLPGVSDQQMPFSKASDAEVVSAVGLIGLFDQEVPVSLEVAAAVCVAEFVECSDGDRVRVGIRGSNRVDVAEGGVGGRK